MWRWTLRDPAGDACRQRVVAAATRVRLARMPGPEDLDKLCQYAGGAQTAAGGGTGDYWGDPQVDDATLKDLLADLESDRVERKAALSDKDKIRQAICAFANDLPNHRRPGVVVIGQNDDGSYANTPVSDVLLQTLAALRSDGNILPFPTLTVEKRTVDGNEIAIVIVEPSYFPPVRCHGRTWIRVGPRRGVATVEEELRLTEKRQAGDLPFDLHPVRTASIQDLDTVLFTQEYLPAAIAPEILAENGRSAVQQLTSLRFAASDGVPTALGVLVLSREPRRFIPCAYIQFLRIDGTDLTDPIKDQREIDGPLPGLLRLLDEILGVNVSVALDLDSRGVEIRKPDYPLPALQQLARNAVLHRRYEGTNAPTRISWFSDRVEILSPGGPFGQVDRTNFGGGKVADYRNPHLAEAMKVLGYVQRFGLGIPLAQRALANNGNPPAEFVVEDTHILAIVRLRS